jgi:hypothetical protein
MAAVVVHVTIATGWDVVAQQQQRLLHVRLS